jgi:hypothetical protein
MLGISSGIVDMVSIVVMLWFANRTSPLRPRFDDGKKEGRSRITVFEK